MKRLSLWAATLIVILMSPFAATGTSNAVVTADSIPLMEGPSFIADEADGGAVVPKGQPVEVVSRTSFTDRLAAIPEDYWYFVRFSDSGAIRSGYIHGSVLALAEGTLVPVFDPPGSSPGAPVTSGAYTVMSSVGTRCELSEGVITVPAGSAATHFTIARFDSSFTPCPGGGYGSIIGFSIVPAADPGVEEFSYEEHIADDPDELQHVKDGFYYFDLGPGTWRVVVRGGPDTVLELTYDLEPR
jgi:hypothetical protein